MKLNQSPSFRVEDYPDQKDWIGRLFISLTPFVTGVSQVLNGNLSFGDNIQAVSQDFQIDAFQEFKIKWPYPGVVPGNVSVIRGTAGTDKTPTILLLAWSYDSSNQQIVITRMSEVQASGVSGLFGRYNFTVRATV